jgi:hypothetical protein
MKNTTLEAETAELDEATKRFVVELKSWPPCLLNEFVQPLLMVASHVKQRNWFCAELLCEDLARDFGLKRLESKCSEDGVVSRRINNDRDV